MLLTLLISVLCALLGLLCQVVNVRLPMRQSWHTHLDDDFFFSFNLCEVHKHAPVCYQRQLVCQKNFLFPNQPNQKIPVLFRAGVQVHYMGETISDMHQIPFNLSRSFYSFVFRMNTGSDILFHPTENICRTSEGDFWNSTCHYMCEFRGWNVDTNKEIQQKEPEIRWVQRIAGEKSCSVAKLGTVKDTCRRCIPSPGCQHGTCVMQDGIVYPNTCQCEYGWYGANCDRDAVCVLANPCQYGTCKKSPQSRSGHRCDCQPGYYGEFCELSHTQPMFCRINSDCKNGGKCIQRPRKPNYCKCLPDFVGNFCEFPFKCPNNKS